MSSVAREYNLPKGTVSAWRARNEGVTGVTAAATQKGDETREGIGSLLVKLLESNIQGLISASSVLRDREWVRQQNAAELGTFIGITHDKVIRMLEAMDRAAATTQPPTD